MAQLDLFLPFNSINGDRKHPAEDLAAMLAALYANGVHPAPNGSMFVRASGGWGVEILPGKCIIEGRIGINESTPGFAVDLPDGVFRRIDRILVRCDFLMRGILFVYRKGTPASNPVPPPLQRDAEAYELCIAQITVNNNTTSIQQENIQDMRPFENVCGYVHALFPIESGKIFAQFTSAFDQFMGKAGADADTLMQAITDWWESMKAAISADDLGNVLVQLAGTMYVAERAIYAVSASAWTKNPITEKYEQMIANANITVDSDVFVAVQGDMVGKAAINGGDVLAGGIRLISAKEPRDDFTILIAVYKPGAGIQAGVPVGFVSTSIIEPNPATAIWTPPTGI